MYFLLALVPLFLSKFVAEHDTGYFRLLTLLDGGSFAFHSSQHVGRDFSSLSIHNSSHEGCFDRPSSQWSSITYLTLWFLRHMCCTNKGSLPWSVR